MKRTYPYKRFSHHRHTGVPQVSLVYWPGICRAGLICSLTALKKDPFPAAFGMIGTCCSLKEGFVLFGCVVSLVWLEESFAGQVP